MEKQDITIDLDEYKALRDICEDYQKLLGEYNLLVYLYKQLEAQVFPKEEKPTKEKRKIGFVYEEKDKQ